MTIELSSNDEPISRAMQRIRTLSEDLWEASVTEVDVRRWLDNFDGRFRDSAVEQINALHLLSHFTYFGRREVEQLLVAMYRDLFRYPLIQDIRTSMEGTRDSNVLRRAFEERQSRTRFLGLGGPAESGTYLLYPFRQCNNLSNSLFTSLSSVLKPHESGMGEQIAIPHLERLVFIDDVIGTGTQAVDFAKETLDRVRSAAANDGREIELILLALFARPAGLDVTAPLFDRVDTVCELSDSERAFDTASFVYSTPPDGVSLEVGELVATEYGNLLAPGNGHGFGGDQLMLGLSHNVPDNTLPIFWSEDEIVPWTRIFKRSKKQS